MAYLGISTGSRAVVLLPRAGIFLQEGDFSGEKGYDGAGN
jgi:hypothetical protein